jgi:TonB family protein
MHLNLLLGSLIIGSGLTLCGMAQTQNKNTSNLTVKNTKNTTNTKEDPVIFHMIGDHQVDIPEGCHCVIDSSVPKLKIYDIVEKMPMFPGGEEELYKFINLNLIYPNSDNDLQGKVICRFAVDLDGSVIRPEILRSLDPTCDKEAVRVIKLLNFIPGKHNGQIVRVYYTIPISFKPE